MGTDTWLNKNIEKLEGKIHEINPSDFRFYNISHLPLLARKTDEHSKKCSTCSHNIEIIDQIIADLPHILTQNSKNRKSFEIKKHKIEKHLKQKHACRFPGYYAAKGSLFGLLLGILFSLFTIYILNLEIFNKLSLIGLAVFLIAGKTIGDYVDKQVFKKNLQL